MLASGTPEYSSLFARRFEKVEIVPSINRLQLKRILQDNGFDNKYNSYNATTYFSNEPGADIWQWKSNAIPDDTVVVRFRQRFEKNPIKNGVFKLKGGGDLEFKIHHADSDRNTKLSIHIPDDIGIENIVRLSYEDPNKLWNVLSELSDKTGGRYINPLALVARIHRGLAVLTTKTSQRDTYINDDQKSKVTIDAENGFYGFPYWSCEDPVFEGIFVAERPDILKVDLKAPQKTSAVKTVLSEIEQISTGDTRAETGMTFTMMREAALKKKGVLVQEEPAYGHEIESKLEVNHTSGDINTLMKSLYIAILGGGVEGFTISEEFPHIESRTGESALRSLYGWVDRQGKIHESITIIEVQSQPKRWYIKRKGDPKSEVLTTMARGESKQVLHEQPDINELIVTEGRSLSQCLIHLGDTRKEKVQLKVAENSTGRIFVICFDKNTIERHPEIAPLIQMETEYDHTPQRQIQNLSDQYSVVDSSNTLQQALISSALGRELKLQPTNLRKIDWLFKNIQ